MSFSVPPCLCRFFPSGKVLAVAEHNTLHICDIGTGTIPRTFKGHSSSINDILFLGSGRNFVTCSSDGTCRLWETSTGEEVDQLVTQGHGSLTCISLIKMAEQSSNPDKQLYFTDGDEAVVIGSDTGDLLILNVNSQETLFRTSFGTSVNAVHCVNKLLLAGTNDGTLFWLKIDTIQHEKFGTLFGSINLRQRGIRSLSSHSADVLYIGWSDGTISKFRLKSTADSVDITYDNVELSGADCEPILTTQCRSSVLWSSSRDGVMRKYSL